MNATIGIRILVLALLAAGYVAIMGAECKYDPCEGKDENDLCASTEGGPNDGTCQAGVCQTGIRQGNLCQDAEEGDACAVKLGNGASIQGTCVLVEGHLRCALMPPGVNTGAIPDGGGEVSPSRQP